MDIVTRKAVLDQRIAAAAQRSGRQPADIRLLAVSKTRPANVIRSLAAMGQQAFGENYLQEALPKITALDDSGIEWHFIGQLQRNKTRIVAENFDWVQSIDRTILAERLADQRPASKGKLNICIQVRMSTEAGKGGAAPESVPVLAADICSRSNLVLRGLMVIPENTTDEKRQRETFRKMHDLYIELKSRYDTIDTLSMGMSRDFELAIEEGSTMIRIGTLLFGQRK
jgi:pyridoxal phosphate enzyme (YggS family)